MSKTHKYKEQTTQKLPTNPNPTSFEEKKRVAYSQMRQLGGLARAKQMAEQGFTPKTKPNPPTKDGGNKVSLDKEGRKSTQRKT